MGRSRFAFLLHVSITVGGALAPMVVLAQREVVMMTVRDDSLRTIPFAWVQLEGGIANVGDDSGRVTFKHAARDSLRFHVRRMGFLPFYGYARRSGEASYEAILKVAPRALQTVRVEERRNTSLALTGFYDRMDRAKRGASTARFITPEELDLRNPGRVSQMLAGETSIKVSTFNMRVLLEGRGRRCGMNVILDGRQMTGMLEELKNVDQNPQLRRDLERVMGDPQGEHAVMQRHAATMTSVDELINAGSVAAIEIYPSPASVPVELLRMMGKGTCGVVVLHSGARK